MKASLIFAAVFGLFVAGALRASPPARVEVFFDHPEDFTDIKDSASPTAEGREAILDALRQYLVDQAVRFLPAGSELKMTFTDIDLAGDYEPWRGPQYDSIRVVKPIYPPAFKFKYQVAAATGKILKQGDESIRDVNFELRAAADAKDPLHFEKDILREWMQKNLGGLK